MKKEKSLSVSRGNQKVKANIFNLPCISTCKQDLECHKYCYAKKAEYLYPNVKPSRTNNLKQSNKPDFTNEMTALLKTRKNNIVRIHESGDFYNLKYVLKWFEVAKNLPEKTFYAYTKRDDLFSETVLSLKPENFTLIFSVDGLQEGDSFEVPKGFDKVAVTHKTLNNCDAITNKKVKCMVDCRKCIDKKTNVIIFKKH